MVFDQLLPDIVHEKKTQISCEVSKFISMCYERLAAPIPQLDRLPLRFYYYIRLTKLETGNDELFQHVIARTTAACARGWVIGGGSSAEAQANYAPDKWRLALTTIFNVKSGDAILILI